MCSVKMPMFITKFLSGVKTRKTWLKIIDINQFSTWTIIFTHPTNKTLLLATRPNYIDNVYIYLLVMT